MQNLILLTALFVLMIAPAFAAQNGEQYEAWTLRCDDAGPAYEAEAPRCEAFQRLVAAENGARMAEFAVGFNRPVDRIAPNSVAARMNGRDTARGVIALPLGISLTDGVYMTLDNDFRLAFEVRYCLADGCYAYLDMPPSVLDKFRNGFNAAVTYRLVDGTPVSLPLSLSGFGGAMQAIR